MKRRITHLVIFLLLGAIINIAVAWACTLWIDAIALEMSEGETAIWYADGYAHAGSALKRPATLIIAYSNTEMTLQDFNEYFTRPLVEKTTKRMDQNRFPSGSLPHLIWKTNSTPSFEFGWDISNGWPFVSLRYRMLLMEVDFISLKPPELYNGLKLSSSEEPITSSFLTGRALPYYPIWPGFVINTLLYASLGWLLFLGPLRLRRHLRHKHGSCLKCGYDLNHADHKACPECGCKCIDCAK